MSCLPYASSDLSKPEDQSDLTVKHSVVKTNILLRKPVHCSIYIYI